MVVFHVPKEKRGKLEASGRWGVHLGLAKDHKGWLIWDLTKQQLTVSRDVKFLESLYYKEWKQQQQKLPTTPLIIEADEVQRPSRQVQVTVSEEEISGVTEDGGEPEVEEQQQQQQQQPQDAPQGAARPADRPRRDVRPPNRLTYPSFGKPKVVRAGSVAERMRRKCETKVKSRSPGEFRSRSQGAARPADRPRRDVRPPNRLTYPSFGKPKVVRAGSVAEQCDEVEIAHCYWAAVPEPKTLAEALSGPDAEKWKQSVKEEYDSLLENEMWELCELPPGKKAISSKLIFRHKYGPDGELTRYKSRLVAKGFQQTKGKDFDEIFAPVGKGTTLRVMLGMAANRGWKIKQMDITTAFLNGIILEELYMLQPEGLDDGSGRVCRLKKAIYGLKQAPRAWYHKLEETLLAGGFKKSECDHSLFLLQEKEQFLMLLVYVDDILLFSESAAMIERVEEMLEIQFKCSKMGDVKYYLGMHVERDLDKGVLRLHQRKYCEGRAEKYGLQDGGKPATPLPLGFTVEPCADEEVVGESDRKLFHSMVGALNYAANHTWPDIAFATSRLASVVSRPSHEQLEAAKRLVCYVSATASLGLEYSAVRQRLQREAADLSKGEMLLTCYTDASFNSVKADGTSIGGYVCLFGGGAVSWRSKKQNEVGLSSCETEYMALHHGVKEVVWLRRLLEKIGVCQKEPTVILCDNESAVKLAKNASPGAATPAAAAELSLYSGSGLAIAAVVRLLFSPLMQLQRHPRVSLTPQQLREWYASWGCRGGRSGSRPGVSSSAAACSGQVRLQSRPRVVLSPQQLREWYAQRDGSWGTARCPYVIRTGAQTGQPCGTLGHAESRCFARLSDAWRTEFGDAAELPDWVELLRLRVDIYNLDYDAILTAMYALPTSDEGDCYLCVPPDPGIEAAALGAGEAATLGASASSAPGAGESALSGTASAQVFHTFTLDSGASRSFFRDRTRRSYGPSPPCVSIAMLALCREHRLEHRTKHIALRYFLARELQQRGQLRLAYVASEANTADIFTKALPPGDHQRFCTMLACFALLDWSCDLLFSPTLPMWVCQTYML
ncbi:unnamed protein product [Closterium sp. NIES-53]